MRILLVEDDIQLADSLADALTAQQYIVDIAGDGESGWNRLCSFSYDLTLLDVALPQMNGVQLCQRLRSQGQGIPVLMLTARDTSYDKVIGLDAGADAYMVKPFDLDELLAQIRALLRRGTRPESSFLHWGVLRLNPITYEVAYGKAPLRLTPKEFSILELLMRHGRRVLSRSFMIESLWPLADAPGEEAVKAHVKSLRQKLRKVGAPSNMIETIHGMGYRLKAIDLQSL
jgi:DNA-binding response OmpR family regulator